METVSVHFHVDRYNKRDILKIVNKIESNLQLLYQYNRTYNRGKIQDLGNFQGDKIQ